MPTSEIAELRDRLTHPLIFLTESAKTKKIKTNITVEAIVPMIKNSLTFSLRMAISSGVIFAALGSVWLVQNAIL